MTYAAFILLFLIVPSGLLIAVSAWLRRQGGLTRIDLRYHWRGVAMLALIAFVWTTPWDNYLIATGVWDSPSDRILFRVGYVPIEEYAFFVLMPILNGAIISFLLNDGRLPLTKSTCREKQTWQRIVLFFLGALSLLGGWGLLQNPDGVYLGLILIWFTPPLMIQWLFDPGGLFRGKWTVAVGTLIPLLYFGLADRLAIGQGIWKISETYTTGYGLPNLPIEEIIFFGVTSLLLVQGLVLWHGLKPPEQNR
ncbi:MAG: lycopene cyclase domain-containing protein [Verrucomicrobia bacterium]|jgi:lycopene cyclase domain-containing protein|nr:lycopene cyclase domain-containing protein [Verrucomicrobiota bacterium]